MATVDLTNDIEPKHPFRPLRTPLSDLRAAIKAADTGGNYKDSYLDKCNRNDLVQIARSVGVELPVRYVEPTELEE